MANNSKQLLDLPYFELCNQAPTASAATSALTTKEDGTDRFVYYLTSSTFYRYDAVADTFQQLATPPTAPVTASTMRYTASRGFHGRVLAATSNTITIPALRGPVLDQQVLRILNGTGAGQEVTLTYTGETVGDAGVITATTTSTLTDSTKKWRTNQWAGYIVGITFGTDATQYKKVLYNNATDLVFADNNLLPQEPWNNAVYVAAAPYALPVVTAGSQAHYVIMSSTFNVSPSFTTVPDTTSYFTTKSGGIYLVSSAAAAPFFTLQYYDVAHDSWQYKTCNQGLLAAALGTDFSVERMGKLGSALASTVGAISSTTRTIVDAGQTLTPDAFRNHKVLITGGTGAGQRRRIVGNSATTITVNRNWDTNPDSTSTYEIWPNFDNLFLGGGAASALYQYNIEGDFWSQGQVFDWGVCANISATINGWWCNFGVTSGARIAAGVQAVASTPTAGGSGYVIGDILTCSVGGTGAQVIVTGIDGSGAVTSLVLNHTGTATGFTTGTGKATTGGTGTGCTINITQVGPTGLITLASGHFMTVGQNVTFGGCTEGLWNATHTVIAVPSTSTICVATTATANMVASNSQSTTVIVDGSANWVTNEHVGRLVHLSVAGSAPTAQIRWITANTSNTITVSAAIVAGVNGTSKYAIYDAKLFGVDDQNKAAGGAGYGRATGGSTTTLQDTSKNWVVNQWAGYAFKVEAGPGYGSGRITITSNDKNTLTYSAQSFTPTAETRYEIADSWGLLTAGALNSMTESGTKNWVTNIWAGKRVKITGGTLQGTEAAITSNTNNTLTTTIGTPDTTSTYAILSIPARGAGVELIWTWGATSAAQKRWIFFPRGGASNSFDIYDIATERWIFGYYFDPQAETFTTGSSYAYDGANAIYLSKSAAGVPIRIFKYDLTTNKIVGFGTTTFLQGTATIGNMMEIVDSPDGYSFLYVLQNTGTLMARALISF